MDMKAPTLTKRSFGALADGREVTLYRLENSTGAYVEFLDYGCIVKTLCAPDNKQTLRNIIVGLDSIQSYEDCPLPPGAIICDSTDAVTQEQFAHTLWEEADQGDNYVVFFHHFAGENGADLDVFIRYMWVDYERFVIDMAAKSGQKTSVNMTSNCLFLLSPEAGLDAHQIRVFTEKIAVKDDTGRCTGAVADVMNGLKDAAFVTIGGEHIDDYYISRASDIRPMAELLEETCGMTLSVYSDLPAIHLQTVEEPVRCIRLAQRFIAAAEGSELPSMDLEPSEEWKHRIVYGVDRIYTGPQTVNMPFAVF